MDLLHHTFAVSGVSTWLFVPPLVAFLVSFFSSMGGVSGAFLLLPFQMSILGYTAPSVSGTNQLFNIVAIPSGVWRYVKEGRMVWPLTVTVVVGTLPGVFIGAWVRIAYLPDPTTFKFFAGLVMCYIGLRLFMTILKDRREAGGRPGKKGDERPAMVVADTRISWKRVQFTFNGDIYQFSVPAITGLCFIVGIVGGIYGIGGGAIIAPFFVTFCALPVYAVAGAALMGTFVTSVAGVIFYQVLSGYYGGLSVAPDWSLGILFGLGGLVGMYCGARCQKYMPAPLIKLGLCFCVLLVAGTYISSYLKTFI